MIYQKITKLHPKGHELKKIWGLFLYPSFKSKSLYDSSFKNIHQIFFILNVKLETLFVQSHSSNLPRFMPLPRHVQNQMSHLLKIWIKNSSNQTQHITLSHELYSGLLGMTRGLSSSSIDIAIARSIAVDIEVQLVYPA